MTEFDYPIRLRWLYWRKKLSLAMRNGLVDLAYEKGFVTLRSEKLMKTLTFRCTKLRS